MHSIDIFAGLQRLVRAASCTLALTCGPVSTAAMAQQHPADASAVPVPIAAPPRVPPPPQQVGAAKAYAVLERHCARCHQDGRLKDGLAGRDLANILALDEIARDRALVVPGVPDASRLYTSILSRQMPSDVFHTQGAGQGSSEEPTGDEIQALRDWINELPQAAAVAPVPAVPQGTCAGRAPVSADVVGETIARAVSLAGPELARQQRFLSLAHLYNACATTAELNGFRQAVNQIVNGLSWAASPVRLEPLGPEQLVLRLSLTDVGWIGAHWEQLAVAYPLRLAPSARLPQPVLEATGTQTPLISADWFADAAMRPPLYYELLGLPGRFGNLQRILRVDSDSNARRGLLRRAGVVQSAETRGPRVIDRHPASTGGLWLSYDLAGSNGRQSLLEHPLGPAPAEASRSPFRHESLKSLFQLPNGFPAFSINDARGDRLDRSPAEVEKERAGGQGQSLGQSLGQTIQAGGACLQCHRAGPLGAKDEVRAFVNNDRNVQRELRDAVQLLYASESELASLVEADQARTRGAMAAVDIDPELRIWGLVPVQALAHAWRRRVDLDRAAIDFGVEPPALARQLSGVTGDTASTARQLRQGVAPRDDVSRLLAELAASVATAGQRAAGPTAAAVPTPAGPPAAADRLDLVVWSDADSYVAGQAATFTAQASQDCNLTLIDVDRSGRATVLFPNEFEQSNRITAGREHKFPGADSPYRFRFKDRGRETIVAICMKNARSPEGVVHDFERLRFTVLGDWQIFLREPPSLEDARRDDAANDRPGPQRRRPRAKNEGPARPSGPDLQARTAITVEVK